MSSAPGSDSGQAAIPVRVISQLGAGGGSGGSNAAASATGSAVPSSASYTGYNSGGNLVGVSTSNPLPVAQQGSVAVTGPLTDTQLRASAVPVSGTFYQSTQPVSGTFWPTTAGSPSSCRISDGSSFLDPRSIRALTSSDQVTVANSSIAVTGPLTDTQLRASAVPVSGPLTDTQLRASAVPVSVGSLPLPSSASQEHAFDVDSGAGTQNVQGVSLRKAASGGSVEYGTSSDPLRIDPTGSTTQPISAASLPLPSGAAQEHTAAATYTTNAPTWFGMITAYEY